MSASLLRPVATASAQVLAVWRAMPGAYLLLGRAAGPLPKSGSARLARAAGAPGIFRTFFWPLGNDEPLGFLTVVRVPDRFPIADEAEIVLRGARGGDRDFPLRLTSLCEEEAFGRQLASLAGPAAAPLARFVLDLMRPEAEVDVTRPSLLLQSFLQHAARHDGCVELLLEIPNRILLLQGWGPPTGPNVEIVIAGSGLVRHAAQVGEFSRNDIQSPLTGSVLALPVELAADLSSVESIFLLTDDKIVRRHVLDSRVLDPAASTGQIRHLLPRLVCPPGLAASLQHALRPQYEGTDTLNTADRRVRAALDIAVAADGAGVFLSGWLLDPACQVSKIEYCAGGSAVQIDQDFVRVQREDVLLAFKDTPSLAMASRSDIGFAVSASLASSAEANPHLRFSFGDDDVAFLPLRLRDVAEAGVRAQLCSGIDMHKPSGIEIVQRHLAPFLAKAPATALPRSRLTLRGPLDRPHAVVVALPVPALPRASIGGLLRDPLLPDEQIIFVCGPNWSDGLVETLIELVQFYDLPATIVTASDRVGPLDAVLLASIYADAATFLIVAPSASVGHAGSRQTLREAAGDADAACATVLYEDGSIRYAGSAELDFTERAPFTRLRARWLGLSGDHAALRDPESALGGSIEYCLLRREALEAAERARRFTTKIGQEAALFAELRDGGGRVVWHPAVVVATADDADTDGAGSVTALVDNWALRACWGETTCAS